MRSKHLPNLCGLVAIAGLLGAPPAARANGIVVTNVALSNATNGSAEIRFDLNWQNSWRSEWTDNGGLTFVTNWDAAWVYVKCRVSAGDWQYAWLNTTGHSVGSASPAGFVIEVGTNGGPANPGVLLHRSDLGAGTVSLTNVALSWNYQASGLYGTNQVDIAVFATEMVYVPQGAYLLGSGSTNETSSFMTFTNRAAPFAVTNESALTMGPIPGALNWAGNTATNVLPTAFPKGHGAFYAMKYEISQGQYADFLNHNPIGGVTARYPNQNGVNRHTISFNGTNYVASAPDRGCNFLGWDDLCDFLAWSGLRPFTELEFEKMCRGFKTNSPNELAFGSGSIVAMSSSFVGTDGSGTETAATAGANINAFQNNGGTLPGPVRVGIFAKAVSTRQASGAGYFGNMELSGNVWEQCISAGSASGRLFAGTHGDGKAIPADWLGGGGRGGSWNSGISGNPSAELQTSDRSSVASTLSRFNASGGRGARTAP